MGVQHCLGQQIATSGPMVCLLRGPYVVSDGARLVVPEGSKRVLVFVAMRAGHIDRRHLAGTLWPDVYDSRAAGNLRSALWRLRCSGIDVLESDNSVVWLRHDSNVDTRVLFEWAGRVIEGSATESDLRIMQFDPEAVDLLPSWDDDWVMLERERMRQRILHALETLSTRLTMRGRYAEAVEAALDAVALDPLRESACRTLVEAHRAEGNMLEARRALATFSAHVERELGVPVGQDLAALVGRAIRVPSGRRRRLA